ncbi:hypothetical protein PN465_01150 [Nodularia spumigena CS-584]|jgi:hypothetical protein|uniref:Uncharacterized protein n=2 Tax=Nodularia spumigena TaxID=70799 RepID=A0A2S0Q6U4_NODSP|nr:hypothetical protein [Nodularia spumigena]AHJ27730.1 hypothetical protein NSP_13900 [Nodularia spumigena CCY9414]AVZ30114.1 hypothetical protein BMF81_01338 [Nodularia spumigena UHCC 0039]EAW42828.1 hypothetical protein N9414_07084 [Nodularia spumigena CCY9414]MDB9380852.1 hypothetical protein [Nodularia spumigena CS-584]MEA5523786.1 hypothetical protein [Nodularia spumigena UHCC 0143]
MSEKIIQPDLFVELSAESQELLSGGQARRPDIIVTGNLTDSRGQSFPVTILGFITGQPSGGPGGGFGGGF